MGIFSVTYTDIERVQTTNVMVNTCYS